MSRLAGILAHRGLWTSPQETNTLPAFEQALQNGFGIELDVRDRMGELVVSHDPPGASALALKAVFQRLAGTVIGTRLPIAINIKSDGLERLLEQLLREFSLLEYSFVFDMSVPSMTAFARGGHIRMATRYSDYEPQLALPQYCSHVWIDCFEREWAELSIFLDSPFTGKTLVFVSPELHGRDPGPVWQRLRESKLTFVICTDRPREARVFFHEGARDQKPRDVQTCVA